MTQRCVRYDQLQNGRGVGRCATHNAWWTTDAWHCDEAEKQRPVWLRRQQEQGQAKDLTGALR